MHVTLRLIVLAALLVLVPLAGAARGETLLVSRASGPAGTPGDGDSSSSSISADGRYVAFGSDADNLSAEDNNAFENIFLRDAQAGTTLLVSRANGSAGAGADGGSSIGLFGLASTDGRYVAFHSTADNLSAEDNNAFTNVFVRDTQAGTTTLASRANGPAGAGGDDTSTTASISADGRYVSFHSGADNLSAEDNNAFINVFVRDTLAGTTTLVSRVTGAAGAGGDGHSSEPSISADGRSVSFHSGADNLSAEDNNAFTNVFVRDTQAGTTTLASRANGPAGAGGDDTSNISAISADGRYVGFESGADNLSAEDNNAFVNIILRDTQAGTTTLVSRATGPAGAGGDDTSYYPTVSADGRYVAFDSDADNLSAEDANAYNNVFVRDIQAGTTTLASRANGASGAGGDDFSGYASIAAGGRFVVFTSEADNLSAEDNNAFSNIFRRDLLGGPPSCANTAQTAFHNTPTAVSLSCTDGDGDAPNRVIVSGPAHGTLGPIDQSTGTATYTPAPRYSGPDSITFRSSDATGTSNVATASLTVTLRPGRCANRLVGTNAAELINGTLAGDRILGAGGADRLNGLRGADCLDGGAGNDRLNGSLGNDSLVGGLGVDILAGGDGADSLSGGAGKDRLAGGRGNDGLAGGSGNDRLVGDAGNDRLAGGSGNDYLAGGSGRNSYSGGAGRDTIAAANGIRELIDCGPGRDTVRADRSDRLRRCEVVRRLGRRR